MNTMQIFSEAGIHALGWTLLHAIWEGSLIALGVWLIRMQLPQAHQRYVLAYGGLMAVLACSAVTFWLVYPQQAMAAGASERARVNVQRRLKDAIARIAEADPVLGAFLGKAVRTGTYCRFFV